MNTSIPDYWTLLEAYHRVREPLYRRIIAEVGLAPTDLILDAGCGDAFYSQLLTQILGSSARVVAVDRNFALLQSQHNCPASVLLCQSDLERAGIQPGVFGAIWVCRVMHAVADPSRWLAALVHLLRPGGKLVVVENDLAHDPMLSLPAEFERRLLAARYQYLESRCTPSASIERFHAARHLAAWLLQLGLDQVTVRTYLSEDVAPMTDEAEHYWGLLMTLQGDRLRPFLSVEDRQTYARYFDPASPDYLLRRPGFYCLEPATVACGILPVSPV